MRFLWERARHAEWFDGGADRFLGLPVLRGPSYGDEYAPLESEGLFLKFAELDLDEGAFAGFAHRYGLLGLEEKIRPASRRPRAGDAPTQGETFAAWVDSVLLMRTATQLFHEGRRSHPDGSKALPEMRIVPGDEGLVELRFPDGRLGAHNVPLARQETLLVPASIPRSLAEKVQTQRAVGAALRGLVNAYLGRYCSPRLVRDGGVQIAILPEHLLGAMWLQLARVIDGNRDFKKCEREGCGEWFEIPLGGTKKRYCTDACKSRAFRIRKRQEIDDGR